MSELYRVLIAEDELLVRMGIRSLLPLNELNMEICADVADGEAAWSVYQTEQPDIIITDIRMPRLNGVELISRIRESDKRTQIIVITCLNDFDILQQAMKLGITDYVVKLTMTREELRTALNKAQSALEMDTRRKSEGARRIAQDELLSHFVAGEMDVDTFMMSGGHGLLDRFRNRLHVGCVFIDNEDALKRKMQDDFGYHIRMALADFFNQLFNPQVGGMWCSMEDGVYLFVTGELDTAYIRRLLGTYLETIVTIYVSEPIESVREIPAVCKSSLSAARRLRFFAGPGSTLSGEASEEVCQKLMQRALPTTSYAGFDTLVPEESQVRAQLIKYASAVGELTMDWSVFLHGTMPEMLASCMRQSGEQRRLSHGVRIAQEYIRAHSECDLNVTDIAQMAGYTPNHMSSLFKKEMGVSITQYITRLRIAHAKMLLKETEKSNADIAEKVGFESESYFFRMFKKETGMTPGEFRAAPNKSAPQAL